MKKIFKLIYLIFISLNFFVAGNSMALPSEFVYLKDIDKSIIQNIKYFTCDNFIGRPIKGYKKPTCILTQKAAVSLSKIQQQLKLKSLSLKIYDCYRPQVAVDDFIAWSLDIYDQKMKNAYYPNIDKANLIKLYIAEKSSHTRGSTVDLTIVSLKTGKELDMGTHFDYMDNQSHVFAENITREAKNNRLFLRNIMKKMGFKPYDSEWWHFTLKEEPFPNTYFNFFVK